MVVKEQTRILSGPKDYEAEAGSTATFRCHAEHDLSLPLRITWFKDGQYIHVNANNRFVQSSDHSLAITRTTEMDSGTYTCKVSTAYFTNRGFVIMKILVKQIKTVFNTVVFR